MSDDVIDLVKAKAEIDATDHGRTMRRKRSDLKKPYCAHRHFEVSMREADVSCTDCGAQLDPWTVLRDLATKHEGLWGWVAQMERTKKDLADEIEALKKQKASLRSSLRSKPDPSATIECEVCGRTFTRLANGKPARHPTGCKVTSDTKGRPLLTSHTPTPRTRWRVVQGDGAALTRWMDETAARSYAKRTGQGVEEVTA